MEFTIIKQDEQYRIEEEGRLIFTCDHAFDDKLLSIHLRNIYGDEAISVYQIKKWYSPLKPDRALDFTIYEGEAKMGELHSIKGGFEFAFQGVNYRFYCGLHAGRRRVICFDRDEQCAQMTLDDVSVLRFENSTLGAMMAILGVLLKEHINEDRFSQELFISKYTGEYLQGV